MMTPLRQKCSTRYEESCETTYTEECQTDYEEDCQTTYETDYRTTCDTEYENQCSKRTLASNSTNNSRPNKTLALTLHSESESHGRGVDEFDVSVPENELAEDDCWN